MSDAALGIGRRVLVTGMAGSGKSTFSRSLAAKTGLPVIHLDLHFWKPGWVAPSELEWREKQSGLLVGDAWIADGNYHETLDLRLELADTVVVLDLPWWRCSGRALLRGFRMPGEQDWLFFILSTRMMPPIAVAIPIYLMFRHLGLNDTHLGLILLYEHFLPTPA